MFSKMRVMLLAALTALGVAAPANAGLIADLNADWSDANNPNAVSFGAWSYREGSNLLPHVADWTPLGASSTQPAWAPGTSSGNFLPAIFKATTNEFDWLIGDIVIHTTDTGNGAANGPANVLWTSDFNGTVDLSGSTWLARNTVGRTNDWSIFLNNTLLSTGAVSGSRASQFSFSGGSGGLAALTGVAVSFGDTIRLEFTRTSTSGDFVGANFTVTEASRTVVPEPGTLLLGCLGIGGIAALRRRKFAN